MMMERLLFCYFLVLGFGLAWAEDGGLLSPTQLKKFVDEIADIPRIKGYDVFGGSRVPKSLRIGMYSKKWHFHRDLPATPVFAYGPSKETATVPGPTIEAQHGISTRIQWLNYLPSEHILPVDYSIPTPKLVNKTGIPTVVHLHGSISDPASDGHGAAWFTFEFQQRGPSWSSNTSHYNNMQQPGTLWYHDHAIGLTRVNLLAGLVGAYVIRQPEIELPLRLPYDHEYDLPLVVFDRSFFKNGSIFMNSTGNNPTIHPTWQPEYFGDVIVVNGKAWPYMHVKRRKYRFRIINASNARFFQFYLTNGLKFVHIASDSAYNEKPIVIDNLLLAPSEIADVVVDFSMTKFNSTILRNNASYPYPSGNPVNGANSQVMKFIIKDELHEFDTSRIPPKLIKYPSPNVLASLFTRYIAMYEYVSSTGEPTHLYINGKSFEDPTTETPKVGSTEIWYVINLTGDNHPLHIHLGLFSVLNQTELVDVELFKKCMLETNNATDCHIEKHAVGKHVDVPKHERGWKNVFKMMPGHVTKILVRFSFINSNGTYPFDATKEPGYAYHCHILDHEDNVMMRPLKLTQ